MNIYRFFGSVPPGGCETDRPRILRNSASCARWLAVQISVRAKNLPSFVDVSQIKPFEIAPCSTAAQLSQFFNAQMRQRGTLKDHQTHAAIMGRNTSTAPLRPDIEGPTGAFSTVGSIQRVNPHPLNMMINPGILIQQIPTKRARPGDTRLTVIAYPLQDTSEAWFTEALRIWPEPPYGGFPGSLHWQAG
jgi:hypothetical protein